MHAHPKTRPALMHARNEERLRHGNNSMHSRYVCKITNVTITPVWRRIVETNSTRAVLANLKMMAEPPHRRLQVINLSIVRAYTPVLTAVRMVIEIVSMIASTEAAVLLRLR